MTSLLSPSPCVGNLHQTQYCDKIKSLVEFLGTKLTAEELEGIWEMQVSGLLKCVCVCVCVNVSVCVCVCRWTRTLYRWRMFMAYWQLLHHVSHLHCWTTYLNSSKRLPHPCTCHTPVHATPLYMPHPCTCHTPVHATPLYMPHPCAV